MNYLKENFEKYKADITGLIKIQSYLINPDDYPTLAMKEVLEYMKSLADRDGMKSYIHPKGYYGYIEIGEGEELIGILGHLDVVPPGDLNSWNSNPFDLIEKDGRLYGRGTQDDKGPVMLCYYLLKQLSEEGKLNKRIRLIMGTDEETLWRGIDKYKDDNQEHVSYGITPDAFFPAIYLEKELVQYHIESNVPANFELIGGTTYNAVPDSAETTINGKNKKYSGKTAHAMEPWEGENAIYKAISEIESDHPAIRFIKEKLNNEIDGKTLFGELIKDDESSITINLGIVKINSKGAKLSFDSRLPSTIKVDEFESRLKKVCDEYELSYKRYDLLQGVYIPKDSKLIKELMSSYQEVTGDKGEAMASSGATYARGMENVVAFGPVFKDTIITEHQPNENIAIHEFIKVYEIYYKTFKKWLK